MTKGDIDGLHFLGRPIKPVAFGLTITMLVTFIINFHGTGRITDSYLTHVLVATSAIALVLLVAGWVGRWQKVAEWGLLATTTTLLLRSSFLGFSNGWTEQAVWLTLATAITAGGAYLLETTDKRRDPDARTRATDEVVT